MTTQQHSIQQSNIYLKKNHIHSKKSFVKFVEPTFAMQVKEITN